MSSTKEIYLDHAASTPTDPQVVEAMLPYFTEIYGNASGLHKQARASARAIDEARHKVADILGCSPKEIVFTACGSESDNIAIRGVAWAQRQAGKGHHLITTPVEHHAVDHTFNQLCDKFGFEQTVVPVDRYGVVNPADIAAAIRPETVLISVMYANNEVGSIQPIAEIGTLARERGIAFHTDAVQAAAYEPLNVDSLNVDLLAISGHKIYAPKGIGILYVRKNTPLLSPFTGGSHENNRRPGTENVPYIVGIARALELVQGHRSTENERQGALRDRLMSGILQTIPGSELTGHPTRRLANHASFVFAGCEADAILMRLDMAGIEAASGSACTTGMPEPSHVLTAMGIPHELALSALRLTVGRQTTEADIETVLNILPGVIEKVRQLNPAYEPAF
ncbi:MAG: cysteine desulfurase NifS [Anaerolineae bacterium]|nr:cysteine desulfurase [Anaerolineales bacterium]MCQ3980025.1 cysteine desulfurase NifS [Anaerolineae bacterium]